MEEIKLKIEDLKKRLGTLKSKLNIEKKTEEITRLEQEMGQENFWLDQETAAKKSQLLSLYKEEIENIQKLENHLLALDELVDSIGSEELKEEITNELKVTERELNKLETNVYLGGKYDKSSAILSIHAGQGGTEAMDWAQMLQRMYMRYAEKKGWRIDIVEMISGEEAGIKSVTMTIDGNFAYGYLKGERGVHRLVRQSPFNADKLRQTSFALVEVLPQIEDVQDIPISEDDLEWEFFRASSHGGQNVQKVSTAVRLRHKPTGIVVTSQSERYQERNREIALSLLRSKLWEIEEEKRRKEEKILKGEFKLASWGNQIRSYVLHPYKMVKDLRTNVEVNDPFSVLDGELDIFIEAELKYLNLN